jgi:hypothetical protein
MPQVKQASKQKRVTKAAIPALGAAGLTFSLLGSASASAVPTADVPQTTHFTTNEAMTLGEEEMLSWLSWLRWCACLQVRWLRGRRLLRTLGTVPLVLSSAT